MSETSKPNDAGDIDQITSQLVDILLSAAAPDDDMLPEVGQEIHDRLPPRLRRLCETMEEGVERAVFLTSSLAVLAGFMVNVRGRCGDGLVSLCLYSMVYGLAGSGKGALRFARRLGEVTDARLFEESRSELARWEVSRDAGTENDTPEPPKRSFFTAGNTSAAAMADALCANGGRGVICESEMASITGAMGQEWGRAVADLLLRCYQGEPITIARKTESTRIPDPALCVAMTGTPASLHLLLPSAESGLLSRCMIYRIDPPPNWISQAPTVQRTERDDLIVEESQALDDIHRALSSRSQPLVVQMTAGQWDLHTTRFTHELMRRCASGMPRTMEAAVKRAGNNAFRIACTLAVLRKAGQIDLAACDTIWVDDDEAALGIDLAMIYLAHSIEYVASLPLNGAPPSRATQERTAWLTALPEEFRTSQAVEVGVGNGHAERTVKRWIADLRAEGQILYVAHGLYRKRSTLRSAIHVAPAGPTTDPPPSRGTIVEGII